MGYQGWALFIDCDFVFLDDVKKLFDQINNKYAVMCAQHDYTPKEGTKMDGQVQTVYPRKNWSSMMLINCGSYTNGVLTKELVNDPLKTGAYFHRFSWVPDAEVGELSHEWNWLVGWYNEPKDGRPKALHYTEGGPWFKQYEDCEYAKEWYKAKGKYFENAYVHANAKASSLGEKRKRDREIDISERIHPTNLIMDDQKKKLIEKFFNYLKDPDGNFYDTNFKEDLMAIRGDRVAAIFPDSDDEDGNFNPQKKGYEFDEYLEALVQGIPKGMLSTWEQEKTSNVPLLIRGLGKKSQLAIKNCWEKQQTFYAIDSGYLGNERTKSKVWHRITKNALQNLGPIKDRANDRMNKIGYKYLKFHPGSKILICPPSEKVMKFWDQPTPEEWTQQTIKELKRYTDRPIEVRLKPKRNERIADGNIVHALQNDVHCVVTYNSIAATEALLNGKPAIALGPNAATVLCNTSLSEVENLNTFDKLTIEGYAAHLTYCQFTKQEMQDGTAWRILNESS
jgi:lipopolysaccharide biosynthesis glycosyltransferase